MVIKCFATLVAFLLAQFTFAATSKAAGEKKQSISNKNTEVIARIDDIRKRYASHKGAEQLRNDIEDLRPLVSENLLVRDLLNDVLEDTDNKAKSFLNALSEAREILAFQPIKEASVPDGFPEYTPVGEIRVNTYPAHRLARVKIDGDETSGFWTLFRHIESNNIAMTAPVSITYDRKQHHDPHGAAMAFLYKSMHIGQTGEQGDVNVIDAEPQLAVSIGMRGESSPAAVKKGAELVKAWLADHANELEAAGDLRIFGYNSPMVPVKQRYFEVQIPVRKK